MYRLQFLNGKFKGKRLSIQQGSVLIGRDRDCQIDLDDDDEVSRHHATIEYRGGSPVIRDMGAMNPVMVNQQPIKEHRLRNGDRIEIGRTVIEYLSGSGSAPPRHRRRFSKMQAVAFSAIGLIILLQVTFVVLFPLWQKREVVPIVLPEPVKEGDSVAVAAPKTVPASTSVVKALTSATNIPKPVASAAPTAAVPVKAVAAVPVSMPAPAATSSAVVAAGVATQAVDRAGAVHELREQVSELRKQYEGIAAAATTSPPAKVVAPDKVRDLPPPAVDPLLAKAMDMVVDARLEISRMNYRQADNILERAQMLAPEFAPAWRERANLYEKRGMLREAGEQWQRVMTLTAGTPQYKDAAEQRQRVARLESRQAEVNAPLRARETASAQRLAHRIRITSVERERFQANEEFDEMRLIRITLRPRNNEGAISSDQVLVVVNFYDRLEGTERLVLTRALVPVEGIRVDGPWSAGETKSVTAAYILKKGFREREEADLGEKRTYEGYRVSVYYRGELQDESAMPRRILTLPLPPLPADKPASP